MNNVGQTLKQKIAEAVISLGFESPQVHLEHPADLSHGDFSTNIALIFAKRAHKNPRELAEQIRTVLSKSSIEHVKKIEVAGSGFINFHLEDAYFLAALRSLGQTAGLDALTFNRGRKIIFDHTQPNPFKEFHIGHLMNNIIGESVSRLLEQAGAEIKRATYHGDVGLHVAKTIWGIKKLGRIDFSLKDLGRAYATGHVAYEDDSQAKEDIIAINKKIYDKSDSEINALYEKGRGISIKEFERLYKKLGSSFDFHFYESEAGPLGKTIVERHIDDGIFERSEGAVVFKGEEYGLHTRVFLTKENLPTYEAKELGLTELKARAYDFGEMVTVTANEQNAFFDVVTKVIELVFPKYKGKLIHLSHGMLKLPTGKMSSRSGTVITAEGLLSEIETKVAEKIKDRDFNLHTKEEIQEKVAGAALRYSVLKQKIGSDIIFDFEKSISFEGDSGPYLQYAYTRANSVLVKAKEEGIEIGENASASIGNFEKLLIRFPEVVERSTREYQPSHLTTYLVELAGAFNSFYAGNQIINSNDLATSSYRLELTETFSTVMQKGLNLLGIESPSKM